MCYVEQAGLPQPEMTGLVHTQHPVLEVLEQAPWACLTHRYFWTMTELVATGSVPAVLSLCVGVCPGRTSSHWDLLAPPMTVFCFHRAAPSYFFSVAAFPLELSICVPEVDFQKQVRTWGKALLCGCGTVLL